MMRSNPDFSCCSSFTVSCAEKVTTRTEIVFPNVSTQIKIVLTQLTRQVITQLLSQCIHDKCFPKTTYILK